MPPAGDRAPSRLVGAIESGVAALDQSLPPGAPARLARLLLMLTRWNERMNLTAVRDPGAMVSAHVLDSLTARPFLAGRRLVDVGTGAGFPGLPLAIAEPDRGFRLIDANARKIAFVRQAVTELGLANVTAFQARAEKHEESFDTVLARALGKLEELVDIAGHLVAPGGVLLAMKGRHPAEELEALRTVDGWHAEVAAVTVPGLEGRTRHIVRLERY